MAFITTSGALVTSASIVDNSIVNADVNSAAAIAYSKLALTGSVLNGDLATSAIHYDTINLSAANILGMFATPVTLVAAPGAGKILMPLSFIFSLTAGGSAFASGGNVRIQYHGGSVSVWGNGANGTILAATVNSATNIQAMRGGVEGGVTDADNSNKALEITNGTGAFTTGNGTAKIFLCYAVITL